MPKRCFQYPETTFSKNTHSREERFLLRFLLCAFYLFVNLMQSVKRRYELLLKSDFPYTSKVSKSLVSLLMKVKFLRNDFYDTGNCTNHPYFIKLLIEQVFYFDRHYTQILIDSGTRIILRDDPRHKVPRIKDTSRHKINCKSF